jgi:hypothetical protein
MTHTPHAWDFEVGDLVEPSSDLKALTTEGPYERWTIIDRADNLAEEDPMYRVRLEDGSDDWVYAEPLEHWWTKVSETEVAHEADPPEAP